MKTTKEERDEIRREWGRFDGAHLAVTHALGMRLLDDADRCAELEAKLKQCALDNECYTCPHLRCGTFKRGPDGCEPLKAAGQRVAELEGFLQQSKDDYQLALRENEKLLAGLEKVRLSLLVIETYGDGDMPAKAVREDIRAALDLAGVDRG